MLIRLVLTKGGQMNTLRSYSPGGAIPTLGRLVCSAFAAAVLVVVLLPATPSDATPVTTTGGEALHWGSFFGNGSADNDLVTSPVAVDLPGTVVEVATSNSTQYASCRTARSTPGGSATKGSSETDPRPTRTPRPSRCSSRPGSRIASLPTDAMPYNTGLALDTTGRAWGWGTTRPGSSVSGRPASRRRPSPSRSPG